MPSESRWEKEEVLAAGLMTGNSMDAADAVLTAFDAKGQMRDLAAHSVEFPSDLANALRAFRDCLAQESFSMKQAEARFDSSGEHGTLTAVHDRYIELCADAIEELIRTALAEKAIDHPSRIDIVGFHGQTVGHCPPSVSRKKEIDPFTIQLGNGQLLADRTGIPVAYDFRSDDLIDGGEAAPLAPLHHAHLAAAVKSKGYFPIAFVNAGNTGNISVISHTGDDGTAKVLGWDTGPFNHFPDLLARREQGSTHDRDAALGSSGRVSTALLSILFESAAVTADGRNFLTIPPPRSSDPQWYRDVPELLGNVKVNGSVVPLADRMRTAQYFSAYTVFYSLTLLPKEMELPRHFGLCGGGWRNPVSLEHFRGLLRGDFAANPVLPAHTAAFGELVKALGAEVSCEPSSYYGFDPTAMEARIFADAAVSLVRGDPFTVPDTTGVTRPCMCGTLRFPASPRTASAASLASHWQASPLAAAKRDPVGKFDARFGRAAPGWKRSSLRGLAISGLTSFK